MILTNDVKKAIASHAKEVEPLECAGLILQNGENQEARKLKNLSAEARYHCFVEFDEIAKVAAGDKTLAIYHSHFESDNFSLEDKVISEKFNIKLVLYCSSNGVFKNYEPNGFTAPYVDRPWRQGIFTCIDIIQDYYKKELNISINGWENEMLSVDPGDEQHFPTLKLKHIDLGIFYSKTFSNPIYQKYSKIHAFNQIYLNFLLKNGFKLVKDFQKHDILLTVGSALGRENFVSHGAIFLGDNKLLHHAYRRKSVVEKFGNNFKSSLRYILRHETLL